MTSITKAKCDQCGRESETCDKGWTSISSGHSEVVLRTGKTVYKRRFDFCTVECLAAYVSGLGGAHQMVAEMEPEETYRVGDWFTIDGKRKPWLLVAATLEDIALINVANGMRHGWTVPKGDSFHDISRDTIARLVGSGRDFCRIDRMEAFRMMGYSV